MLPWMLGKKPSLPTREVVVHHSASGKVAIRKGDWVLIDGRTGDDNGKQGEPQWLKDARRYVADAAEAEAPDELIYE